VSGKLAKEIRQTRPFRSRSEEAFLNLGRTWQFLELKMGTLLKEHKLTPTQYNLLRILRGAGAEGVTCSQATERMLSPDPDMTRLVDRMIKQELVRRDRDERDRRVVITRITDAGLGLVNRIDGPLHQLLQRWLGRLGQERLKQLIEMLEELREPPE